MTTTLDAGYVYAMDDGEVVVVGFADREYETQQYVLLQRERTVSRGDQLLGHDLIHITVDDQGRACYGGIRLLKVDVDEVRIELDEACARELKTDVSIRIRFSADEAQRARLTESLKELFANALTSLRMED